MTSTGPTPLRACNKLLLASILAVSCGDPNGAPPGASNPPKAASFFDTTGPQPAPPPAPAREPTPEVFRGAFRRIARGSEFLPCGARAALLVEGSGDAMMVLRDRWRWHATAAGRTLFGVFQGFIVRDSAAAGAIGESGGTGTAVATDSPRAARVPARFRLTRVDTLRTWRDGDCGRSHPPRW